MTAVALGLLGIVVHLAIVAWIFMDANVRKVGGCQWALFVLCFPGVSLIAYARATGSRQAWLMLLMLVVAGTLSILAFTGHIASAVTPKAASVAAAAGAVSGRHQARYRRTRSAMRADCGRTKDSIGSE